MKHTLIAIFIIAATACSSPKTKATKGNDTTGTTVAYIFNANTNDFRLSAAVRFAIDSVQIKPDSTDPARNITTRVVDTLYNIPTFQRVTDSAGAVLKTTKGQDSVRIIWLGYEKRFVLHDYNVDYNNFIPRVDSTVKK